MTQKPKALIWRILGRILTIAIGAALVAVFFLGVILGQPQESQQEAVNLNQPLLAPAADQQIVHETQLGELISSFPVPVLCAAGSSGYTLDNGSAYDIRFEKGMARVTQLQYHTEDNITLMIYSIYPARALEVLQYVTEGGMLSSVNVLPEARYELERKLAKYHLVSEGSALAGMRTVRMENGEMVRLHTQSADGLYAVIVPLEQAASLTNLIRPLQLITYEGM